MKRLLMWLSIIALTACGGGGGGPSAPTTHSISGTTKPGTALSLVKPVSTSWNDVIVVADTTADATTGKYSFPGIVNGDYEVSAWLIGNTFSPPYVRLKLDSADYPRVDFTAIPNAGTGVTLSGTLGGFNSVADTHCTYVYTSYTCIAGGETVTTGSLYTWLDSSGAAAFISYDAANGLLHVNLMGAYYYGVFCGVNGPVSSNFYPSCSSVGVTFDHANGVIILASTPIYNAILFNSTSTGFTATGSLTFQPF